MPTARSLRISKASPELANFEVAGVPNGRELSYPGVANVIGNALRELNLEDVEPADAAPAEQATQVEYRTFDGLVVKIMGVERDDESWITLEASADCRTSGRRAAACRACRRRRGAGRNAGRAGRPERRGGAHQRQGRRLALQDRRLPIRPADAPHGGPLEGAAGPLTPSAARDRSSLTARGPLWVNCVPFRDP